jgi:hypothetical protein
MESQIQVPSSSIKYIVPKGFVCVDGTSLTICEVDAVASTFTFMLVAHTQQNVIIPNKIIGISFLLFPSAAYFFPFYFTVLYYTLFFSPFYVLLFGYYSRSNSRLKCY